jgi:hypothetical protein
MNKIIVDHGNDKHKGNYFFIEHNWLVTRSDKQGDARMLLSPKSAN